MKNTVHKTLKVTTFLFLMLLIVILQSFSMYNTYNSYSLLDFLEQDRIDELYLTITYIEPGVTTMFPLNTDTLLGLYSDTSEKVVVTGNDLQVVKDTLYEIATHTPKQVQNASTMNARIHYKVTTKFGINVFEVVMWSVDNNIYVNNVEIEESDVYYELLVPFVSDQMSEYLLSYMNSKK